MFERFNWKYALVFGALSSTAAWGIATSQDNGEMKAALTCAADSKKLEVSIGNRPGDLFENAQLVLMLTNAQGQEILVTPQTFPKDPSHFSYLQHTRTMTNNGEMFEFSDQMQVRLHRGVLPTVPRRVRTVQEYGDMAPLESDFEPGAYDDQALLERFRRAEILDQTEVSCKKTA